MDVITILAVVAAAVIGALGSYLYLKKVSKSIIQKAEKEAEKLKEDTKKEVEKEKENIELERKKIELESKEYKSKVEKELEDKRVKLEKKEESVETSRKRLEQKEDYFEKREEELDSWKKSLTDFEKSLEDKENHIEEREKEIEEQIEEYRNKLQEVSEMSREQAKNELKENLKDVARQEAEQSIKKIKEDAKETANKQAKMILSRAIQKCSVDHTVETTVSVVSLPSDEMKGRIIGRTGRNIRAFENATGVDVVVDDTPEAVVLSCFDSIRREVARIALEKLIADGRIHPSRIEEVKKAAEREVAETIKDTGQQAVLDMGVVGVHPEIIKLLGKEKYRTSYGQNVLQHSIEVGYLCGALAGELGMDENIAKRIGLLHDIGKVADQDKEGTHAIIGGELAEKYGEKEQVVEAIKSHHEEQEVDTIFSVLVQAADAISSSRPGARKETYEAYIKRINKLEDIAREFEGVQKCYAIQAGREIRVIVEPDKVDDSKAGDLGKQIAEKIESDIQYPGTVKVNIIREVRYAEYAK